MTRYLALLRGITAKLIAHIGETQAEYEKAGHYGRIIFWTANLATFSRTSWSKISKDKAMYQAVTIRNANTTLKLGRLVSGS